jgi:3-deoxy-D-manno-octulosonate 8-phosphate phosphatase (KDO 8-P phosphatase)
VNPGSPIPEDLARKIRLVILDVDGVMTDSGVYVGELPDGGPVELKRFNIQDGVAVKLLRDAGVEVAIVSGRVSQATAIRARELGIQECHQDPGANKIRVLEEILARKGISWEEVAFLGDDIRDIAAFRRVGLPAAVGNATEEAKAEAVWCGVERGGEGAVREFCKALLEARGEWVRAVEEYVDARSR